MKRYIVDASFVLSFLLPDELNEVATKKFQSYVDGKIDLVSSPILNFEVANGLKSSFMFKRIDAGELKRKLLDFINLKIKSVSVDLEKVVNIAVQKELSVYDSTYLFLSKELGAKLLTFDKSLQ